MKIDGKAIADGIFENLRANVSDLRKKGIIPTLAVIQVGNDPGSTAYINQKKKAAERIGANIIHNHPPSTINNQQLQALIGQYNTDPSVHGLIVQRPLPEALGDASKILDTIRPEKDVDGFLSNSLFDVPVAAAVLTILHSAFSELGKFDPWLKTQRIVVIGRGDTAGKPIAEHLRKLGCNPNVVHSKTPNPDAVIQSADIVISCVGKPNVVRPGNLKPGAILIGVGLWRDNEGKLRGDYDEEKIAGLAAGFTPTPGGVGPVNVACLMQNLVKACILK